MAYRDEVLRGLTRPDTPARVRSGGVVSVDYDAGTAVVRISGQLRTCACDLTLLNSLGEGSPVVVRYDRQAMRYTVLALRPGTSVAEGSIAAV